MNCWRYQDPKTRWFWCFLFKTILSKHFRRVQVAPNLDATHFCTYYCHPTHNSTIPVRFKIPPLQTYSIFCLAELISNTLCCDGTGVKRLRLRYVVWWRRKWAAMFSWIIIFYFVSLNLKLCSNIKILFVTSVFRDCYIKKAMPFRQKKQGH